MPLTFPFQRHLGLDWAFDLSKNLCRPVPALLPKLTIRISPGWILTDLTGCDSTSQIVTFIASQSPGKIWAVWDLWWYRSRQALFCETRQGRCVEYYYLIIKFWITGGSLNKLYNEAWTSLESVVTGNSSLGGWQFVWAAGIRSDHRRQFHSAVLGAMPVTLRYTLNLKLEAAKRFPLVTGILHKANGHFILEFPLR